MTAIYVITLKSVLIGDSINTQNYHTIELLTTWPEKYMDVE